jgi:endonuclease/exonuclease/phosphatase family metal-dependent hydrolase
LYFSNIPHRHQRSLETVNRIATFSLSLISISMSGQVPRAIDIINRPFRGDKIKILITTWNMGNAEPAGLQSIFGSKSDIENFDVFAIGLQESTYTMKAGGKDADCISQLAALLKEIFGPNYYLVAHCHRAQMQLYLFAKGSLKHRIGNLEMSIENTGFLHVFPNKGGLLVTFDVDGTKLAFVSCHLTAHEGVTHCEQRNASIVEILGGVRAGDKNIDITEQFHHVFWMGDMNYRLTFDSAQPANTKKNIALLNSIVSNNAMGSTSPDSVQIVLGSGEGGNENTHLDEKKALEGLGDDDSDGGEDEGDDSENPSNLPPKKLAKIQNRKKILDMIVKEQWRELLELDELNREIAAKRVLNDFNALQPHWPPTFKRTRMLSILPKPGSDGETHWQLKKSNASSEGTSTHEGRAVDDYYNHKRIPSFTDRILHKSMRTFATNLTNEFFLSSENALSSDHKPVKAGFELAVTKGRADIFVHRDIIGRKGTRNVGHKLRLIVDNLKGYELEEMDAAAFGGGSDPYIVIKADPPTLMLKKERIDDVLEGVKSGIIYHNLNPVWDESMELVLGSLDFEGLSRNASLMFEVWDYDKLSADDLIGVFTIPMKSILRAIIENRPYQFDEILRMNSEIMGRLTGTIRLDGNFADIESQVIGLAMERGRSAHFVTLAQAEVEQQQLRSGGCNCVIN